MVALMQAPDDRTAIALANDTRYGLSASVFTRDIDRALDFTRDIEAGVVHVNGPTTFAEPQVAFGGMKASSSHSREQGKSAVEFYTQVKTVYVERGPRAAD